MLDKVAGSGTTGVASYKKGRSCISIEKEDNFIVPENEKEVKLGLIAQEVQKIIPDVIVDKEWMKLWSIRMENPLEDAETLKIHDDKIVEIGKKATNYSDIEGQYIGLIRISKSILNRVIDFYDKLDRFALYDGQTFDNMYMTTFIQLIINNLLDVTPIFINGRWLEIDTIEDLLAYNKTNLLLNK